MADLPGRAQIVTDPHVCTPNMNFAVRGLVFYLDGAHSPESSEVCARWFSNVIREETQSDQVPNESCKSKQAGGCSLISIISISLYFYNNSSNTL